jgi:hypothetical protein
VYSSRPNPYESLSTALGAVSDHIAAFDPRYNRAPVPAVPARFPLALFASQLVNPG